MIGRVGGGKFVPLGECNKGTCFIRAFVTLDGECNKSVCFIKVFVTLRGECNKSACITRGFVTLGGECNKNYLFHVCKRRVLRAFFVSLNYIVI